MEYPSTMYSTRQDTQSSLKSQYSSRSGGSYSSQSTAATSLDDFDQLSRRSDKQRPSLKREITATHAYSYTYGSDEIHVEPETYYSSDDSFSDEDDEYYYTQNSLRQPYSQQQHDDEAIPTTPSNFADYFPQTSTLKIAHDTTNDYDGDMNLVISTDEYVDKKRNVHRVPPVQLYHLRMNDLATRKFSLRRYCRESGREVCETYTTAASRPALSRTMSNALASMKRTPSWSSSKSGRSTKSMPLKRQDSGCVIDDMDYESGPDDEIVDDEYFPEVEEAGKVDAPTNITKMLFTNLAQVYVKRKGQKANKHWNFEYWGKVYEWRRIVESSGDQETFKYCLYRQGEEDERKIIATIKPDTEVSEYQRRQEQRIGAWVPASTFKIHDLKALGREDARADLADVIVASGVIALTDDCIRRLLKAQKKQAKAKPEMKRSISFKVGQEKVEMEFVTPMKMMEHWMKPKSKKKDSKRDGLTLSRPSTSRSSKSTPSSPLKQHATHAY